MSDRFKAIRGMHDVLPQDSAAWQLLENSISGVLDNYGYQEIRTPIVENSNVFSRSIGEATDIVQKEMYTFADRNGDSLTLRPEGTASCVRAILEHQLIQTLPQRLWYRGPMFRHERPQRGRLRQFHQVGVEVFGAEGPEIDAEIILMSAAFWRQLGLKDCWLELNTLGDAEARARHREVLVAYFSEHRAVLDEDSLRRLETNPLRILDSKNPAMEEVIASAPTLVDHIDDASREHFDSLCQVLDDNNIGFQINPRLVRGLDYYSRTVFEWKTDRLGAQGTICAGGRYDGLVELMGGKPLPAIGFALGLERLLELVEMPDRGGASDIYVTATDPALELHAISLAEQVRRDQPTLRTVLHVNGGSMKSRMKRADRSGAQIALILGPDEHAAGAVAVRYLRSDQPQTQLAKSGLDEFLTQMFRSGSPT